MRNALEAPISLVPGVGERYVKLLSQEADIVSVGDLLAYYPYRYIDRSVLTPIRGMSREGEHYQFVAQLVHIACEGVGRKQRLVVDFQDASGRIRCVFFKGIQWLYKRFRVGGQYLVFGRLSVFGGSVTMAHPEVNLYNPQQQDRIPMEPLYHASEKMKKAGLNSRGILRLMGAALQWARPHLAEYLPEGLLSRYRFMPYGEAVTAVHFPRDGEQARHAIGRLKFDELFGIQVQLLQLHESYRIAYKGFECPRVGELTHRLYREALPFDLTNAQKRVVREIRGDMGSGRQMNRLLQGDVGSGKTVVALFTMLLAADNGYQAMLMAPTEILAQQHFGTLSRMLSGLPVHLALLTGSTPARARREILVGAESGYLHILVGTHALIEDWVRLPKLGVVVVDEQQRFGVDQRAKLWRKAEGYAPHVLIMTATPIPRTLALTLYGDLDVSVIDELPPGRKPIRTAHMYETQRAEVYGLLQREVAAGRQAYVVFPLIEENGKLELQSLTEGHARLVEAFPSLSVEIVHGRMRPEEKEAAMGRFKRGEAHILVSTTVIEVGVDVPNATVMVIENADRFGLSQLHQLRGRVGRGGELSHCVLVTDYKLSSSAHERLATMVRTTNGFEIAEADMRLRGSGSLEGTQQSGHNAQLKLASLAEDGELLGFARDRAREICAEDPLLLKPENEPLREHIASLKRVFGYEKVG
ncbi:MAG: ATP-dependent DNA helicase RecG [Bacteroidia bacterium]|nr:MAG: ATP-dependent DNA helicase RecG [Bacteroidia bacterium]